MILGRPTNLWLGVVTAGAGVATVLLLAWGFDPRTVAQTAGAVVTLMGALIALVAGQPPAVNPGGAVTVHTANGDVNATARLGLSPRGQVTVLDRRIPEAVADLTPGHAPDPDQSDGVDTADSSPVSTPRDPDGH